jgi:hypothetical protein
VTNHRTARQLVSSIAPFPHPPPPEADDEYPAWRVELLSEVERVMGRKGITVDRVLSFGVIDTMGRSRPERTFLARLVLSTQNDDIGRTEAAAQVYYTAGGHVLVSAGVD